MYFMKGRLTLNRLSSEMKTYLTFRYNLQGFYKATKREKTNLGCLNYDNCMYFMDGLIK